MSDDVVLVYRDVYVDLAAFLVNLAEIGCGASRAIAAAKEDGYSLSERLVRKYLPMFYENGLIDISRGRICSTTALLDLLIMCEWNVNCIGRIIRMMDHRRQLTKPRI